MQAVVAVMMVVWSRVPTASAFLSNLVVQSAGTASVAGAGACGATIASSSLSGTETMITLGAVLELANSTAGRTLDADAPLMEAGIDSLGAVDLRNQLQKQSGEGTLLPSTIVFDHPTARQLSAFFQEAAGPVAAHEIRVRHADGAGLSSIPLTCMSAVFPDGKSYRLAGQ